MICAGMSVDAIIATAGGDWPGRVRYMKPKNILELGTGQGASGAQIMSALPPGSVFTTIAYDYPTFDEHGEQLNPYNDDPRLHRINGDTTDPALMVQVPEGVDLLFIDTTHEAWHAATELRVWQYRLQDGAIVVVDDLDQHDMSEFWCSLPYEKVPAFTGTFQGMFRYDAARRYTASFGRPPYQTTYYGGWK